MTANPYDSPKDHSHLTAPPVRSLKRLVAYSLIAVPFLLALPLRYWALNLAGGWFVSTDLEPDHRRAFLGVMYFGLMLAISVWCFFGASILLWRDRFYPVVSACAAIIFGVLAIPAGIFLTIGLSSYFRYG
jgi:hypothetical protein